MEELLKIENLEKHYEGFSLHVAALSVAPGTVVGLIGSNGAGKTTTLKAALGLINSDGGAIEMLGQPIAVDSSTIDKAKARVGIVLDTCAFPSTFRVKDAAALGGAAYATWDQQLFWRLCDRFELSEKKTVAKLSRGMGMKLSLAFALAHHPQLLILDEATAGLDPIAREEVLDILRRFMEQETHGILMSTHITSDLEKIADKVICIDGGTIVFDLDKEAISDQAAIARCRQQDLEAIAASGMFDHGTMRFLTHGFSTDLLVPDRFTFARQFPNIALDRATIEDYMTLSLKGEAR